ncbi:MAG: UTP--glucose-1-phosphate uridylyltransferase [Deltaproteobacteria bacterium]|jgi:UTP--glucose-1-phosphate uridylyltransferase|nr:UTP--glucose-1-phosphate uridylyltransferase [Deltaproteobacteria bacterium]|tara:strand:- start:3557 stop:4390 length:834 start_codon:yes stop_codon:yes gene_type:complete
MSIRKCLFPAAGYGTRFLPATKAMPKEMMPIVSKPLIQYGVEEAMTAGMREIGIVTGRGKRAIEDHFDKSYELENQIAGTGKENLLAEITEIIARCRFSYTRQVEMLGLGHAILVGEGLVGNEPFGVILADDYCVASPDSVMQQMVKIYEKYQCSVVAVEEVSLDKVSRYGVIDGVERDGVFRVSSMVEKPRPESAPSQLAIIGRYILTPDIFEILRKISPVSGGELHITDALNVQARNGGVIGLKFSGSRFDCGGLDGFVAATNYTYDTLKMKSGV